MGKRYFDNDTGHTFEVDGDYVIDYNTRKEYILNPDHTTYTEVNPDDSTILGKTKIIGNERPISVTPLDDDSYYKNSNNTQNVNNAQNVNNSDYPYVDNLHTPLYEPKIHKGKTKLLRRVERLFKFILIIYGLYGVGSIIYSVFCIFAGEPAKKIIGLICMGIIILVVGLPLNIFIKNLITSHLQKKWDSEYEQIMHSPAPKYSRRKK